MIDGKESRIREALDRFKYGPGSNKMIYAGIVVTMLLFAGILFMVSRPADIVGYAVVNKENSYSDDLGLEVNSSSEEMWFVGHIGSLKSIRVSGSVGHDSNARVYIENDDRLYLVFDSSQLEKEGLDLITGLVVEDEVGSSKLEVRSELKVEKLEEFKSINNSIRVFAETDSALGIDGDSTETSADKGEVEETNIELVESNNDLEENNNIELNNPLIIQLGYNDDSSYDVDNDGVEGLDGVIDLTVEDSLVSGDKLCTKWIINNLDNNSVNIVCHGNEDCCNFINLNSVRDSWDEALYLSYGKYGAGLENVVSAQVINADYNLSVDNAYANIDYSDTKNLSAVFEPLSLEFKDICVESCSLFGFNSTVYKLIIEADGFISIDSIGYVVEEEVSDNLAVMVKEIPDIYIEENGRYVMDLSSYFGKGVSYYSPLIRDIVVINEQEGVISFVPQYGYTGSQTATIVVKGGSGLRESNEFTITVGKGVPVRNVTKNVSINLTNKAPKLVKDIPDMVIDGNYSVNLSKYFVDNEILKYSYYKVDDVLVEFKQDVAEILSSGFDGTRYMFFSANDSLRSTVSNVFKVEFGEAADENITAMVENETVQELVVVNKPVKWSKKIVLNETVSELEVDITSEATNITVKKIISNNELEIDKENIKVIDKGEEKELQEYEEEKMIEQIDSKISKLNDKKKEADDVEEVNEEISNLRNEKNSITGYAVSSSGDGLLTRFFEWLFNVDIDDSFSTTHSDSLSDQSIPPLGAVTGHAVAEVVEEDGNATLVIEEAVSEVEVEYYTPGPETFEKKISDNKKEVVVSSEIHYENILSYTSLPMEVPLEAVKIYHLVDDNQSNKGLGHQTLKEEVQIYQYDDVDNDGLVEVVYWIVPSLSNQTYEVSITVLNVQSYPTVGGNWTVEFETVGSGDLVVYGYDGTSFGYGGLDDLEFLDIRCGDDKVDVQYIVDFEDSGLPITGFVSGVDSVGGVGGVGWLMVVLLFVLLVGFVFVKRRVVSRVVYRMIGLFILCPKCNSKNLIKEDKLKNKILLKQRYSCKDCGEKFSSDSNIKFKTYPAKAVLDAISYYNKGLSLSGVCKEVGRRYKIKVSKSTVGNWVKEFKELCSYNRIRKASKVEGEMIVSKVFNHLQTYVYMYHKDKVKRFVNRYFAGIRDYLKRVVSDCPDSMFVSSDSLRCSKVRISDDVDVKVKDNAACKLASLAVKAASNNYQRHSTIQKFMVANDTSTIGVEVPVWMTADEVGKYGFLDKVEKGKNITGHIDLLQIRYGRIYVLDYKPGAGKEDMEKVVSQLFMYALALSERTGVWLRNIRCAWFDSSGYYEFDPNEIVLKKGIPSAERKKYRSDDSSSSYYTDVKFHSKYVKNDKVRSWELGGVETNIELVKNSNHKTSNKQFDKGFGHQTLDDSKYQHQDSGRNLEVEEEVQHQDIGQSQHQDSGRSSTP